MGTIATAGYEALRRSRIAGGSAGASSPTVNAARSAAVAASASASVRACTTASGASAGPTRSPGAATSLSPTAWSTDSASWRRPPPSATTASPTARTSTFATIPARSGRAAAIVRRDGQVRVRLLEEVGRPAELGDHRGEALGGRPAAQRLGRVVAVEAAEGEELAAELDGDLDEARVARRAGEVVDRLADLERVARGATEDAVHVGDQGAGREPVARRDVDDRLRELAGGVDVGHERARARLDVHDERVQAGGELLAQDRGDDERQRLDGRGGVADRVQPAVGRGEVARLADDRAARVPDRGAQARRGPGS